MQRVVYSVSQINNFIKGLLDSQLELSNVLVRGELSNYKRYPSGHHYFTLKDAGGAIRCVMFKREASKLKFQPENGMAVIVTGRVTVFPRDGQYQLYCSEIIPEGAGALNIMFQQLKERLYKEGLFNAEYKKPLPRFPQKIAIITSPAGAAVRDILRILGQRYPLAEALIVPVRVQGEEAAGEIAAAIRYVNEHKSADVIITGRGGGSLEDLWAFNEEIVARAIFASEIPIISAVGHEPDVTISDFVADVRASTPSNAAEIAVPDYRELVFKIDSVYQRIKNSMDSRMQRMRALVDVYSKKPVLADRMVYIGEKRMQLDSVCRRMYASGERIIAGEKKKFVHLAASLDALSPMKVLGRGYAITRDAQGKILKSISDVENGETLEISLSDGSLKCSVLERICRDGK